MSFYRYPVYQSMNFFCDHITHHIVPTNEEKRMRQRIGPIPPAKALIPSSM